MHTVTQGDRSNGIYLVISGLIKVEFKHDQGTYVDFLGAGNEIGEIGVLTKTRRSASVASETAVSLYFLAEDHLETAMQQYNELARRLWRICGIRTAVTALAGQVVHPARAVVADLNVALSPSLKIFCGCSTR